MKYNILYKTSLMLWLLLAGNYAMADIASDVDQLQKRWAEVNYQLEGDPQLVAFEDLIVEADRVTAEHPDQAPAWIWSGIIKSTFAGAKGGLGALGLAKDSKRDLEQAMDLDADALNGSAYTSLGTLYYSVPGWPVGFGNDDKAEEFLLKALLLSPDSIDNNYFYGSYLITEKRFAEARDYLARAQQAPARPGRAVADAGRQVEISQALEDIQSKR
jgi:tetratricopeptide (TPR) repeat protein